MCWRTEGWVFSAGARKTHHAKSSNTRVYVVHIVPGARSDEDGAGWSARIKGALAAIDCCRMVSAQQAVYTCIVWWMPSASSGLLLRGERVDIINISNNNV